MMMVVMIVGIVGFCVHRCVKSDLLVSLYIYQTDERLVVAST